MVDWRNRAEAALDTDARLVVLHGDNGQGKTNLLEAVYLLASLRSFRDAKPARLVREGASVARVEAGVRGTSGLRALCWQWQGGERQIQIDGNPASVGPWFEILRAILFCPEQVAVIRGEPDQRRRFLDRAVFTARPLYLELASAYRRVVLQKGALLRSGRARTEELNAWDDRLATLGAKVMRARWEMVEELRGPFQDAVGEIGGEDRVSLRLRSLGGEEDGSAEARLRRALADARADEIRGGQALTGPHRDDLEISLDGRSARRFASQGQARTLALALKLAEMEAAGRRGQSPLFLLDDLGGELDRGRRERLLHRLLRIDCQVWITTTDLQALGPLPATDLRAFRVSAAAVDGGSAPG